jgi:hypothetical protein
MNEITSWTVWPRSIIRSWFFAAFGMQNFSRSFSVIGSWSQMCDQLFDLVVKPTQRRRFRSFRKETNQTEIVSAE